ncbi:MAG: DUF6503 family protein [Bacteroidota bacterium]
MKYVLPIIILFSIFFSCSKTSQKALSQEAKLIAAAVQAHGGALYQKANYSFVFRGTNYSFRHNGQDFTYERFYEKKDKKIVDRLTNAGFQRSVNGEKQPLNARDSIRFGNSLNSVIYFALLPYKLEDPAVKKAYKGSVFIKGQEYQVVEVSFREEGGGTDFEDVFYYWLHKDNHTVDYLAYQFHVNKGGVRFRSAYNPRIIDGIRFQDYVNYKADADTPLAQLPKLFEEGKLSELSRIELKDVKLLPPNM